MQHLRTVGIRIVSTVSGVLLTASLAACNGPIADLTKATGLERADEVVNVRSKMLTRNLFGQLPKLPKGPDVQDKDGFTALGDLSGRLRTAYVVRPTWFASDGWRCRLTGGTTVYAVAKISTAAGDFILAHLKEPCTARKSPSDNPSVELTEQDNSAKKLSEAYLPADDVKVSDDEVEMAGEEDDDETTADAEGDDEGVAANGVCQSASIGMTYDQGRDRRDIFANAGAGTPFSGNTSFYQRQSIPGNIFRNGGQFAKSSAFFIFEIPGDAPKVSVKLTRDNNTYRRTFSCPTDQDPSGHGWNRKNGDQTEVDPESCHKEDTLDLGTLKLAKFEKVGDKYYVELGGLIPENNWGGTGVSAEVSDENGVSEACSFDFSLASPILLDLANKGEPDLIHPSQAQVTFDLDGDGKKETIGWFKPHAGLLAADFNRNGKIDSGKELFGEFTNGKRFRNGYHAMSHYDADQSGSLDQQDPIFEQLLVWQDHNLDGVSQPLELKPLGALGVNRIETQFQHIEKPAGGIFDNFVPYQSRFYGPAHCGEQGCKTFDVFFGVMEARPMLSKRGDR